MDFIVVFFRDILDGPLYIGIVIVNSILICSCIGYLADNAIKRKQAKENYNNTYVSVDNYAGVNVGVVSQAQSGVAVQSQAQPQANNQVTK